MVSGQIAQYPLGGMTWHYMDYVLGLTRLGHEIYYLEDTGQWPYNPEADGLVKEADYNVRYLRDTMERFGLGARWAYRFPWQNRWFGMSELERREMLDTADMLINVSGTLQRPQEYRPISRLVYVDTDPVFTQVKLARGQRDFRSLVDAHDVLFSYGECLEQGDLPDTGHSWLPTRPPVVLSEWTVRPDPRPVFTTVMNWTSHNSVEHRGVIYGQKDVEFRKIIDLPAAVHPIRLEVAAASGHNARTPYDLLRHKGWAVANPADVCADMDDYRTYTESSLAEFTVAKGGYVRGQSGWFSERSARYLASGRPVVSQETGFSRVIPCGEGLHAFSTFEEAVVGIEQTVANYRRESAAAREIAEAHFDSARVLDRLLGEAFSGQQLSREVPAVEIR